MKEEQLIKKVKTEISKAQKKHPVLYKYWTSNNKANINSRLDHFRACNDADEKNGCQSFERVCLEELLEIIQAAQAGDEKERIHETLQLIGVLVRSIQEKNNDI